MNVFKNNIINKKSIFLIAVWFIAQFLVFQIVGVNFGFEGDKYISDANNIISLHQLNSERLFYSFLPIVIAIIIKLKLELISVIFLQLFVNLFAFIKFFQIINYLFTAKWVRLILPVAFVFSLQIQQWNFYLFTESFFISGLIFLFHRIVFFDFASVKHFIIIAILFIILSFIRPVGIFLVLPLIGFFWFSSERNKMKSKTLSFGILLFSFVLIIIANIVFNWGQLQSFISQAYGNNWTEWTDKSFITNYEPGASDGFFHLIFWRIIFFFSMYRNYFSDFHNALLMGIIPFYLFFIYGIKSFLSLKKGLAVFVILLITVCSIFAIFTFLNWQGRFIAPLIPFFILGAGFGLQKINDKIEMSLL